MHELALSMYTSLFSLFSALCPALSEIDNGMIVYRADTTAPYDIGTVATYRCNPGYALKGGNDVRTCEDPGDGNNNRFNGEAPTCELLPPDGKKGRYVFCFNVHSHTYTHSHAHTHTQL